MGAHSAITTSSSLPGGAAVAATGLTVLGLVTGAGVAFAGDAPSGSAQDTADSSECSVGGTPAGGTGTGSPDGVITNGQCSEEQIEQAQHDADTDGDPDTRGSFDSHPESDSGSSSDEDTSEGNPNVVGGTGDGVSSQSGTAQKADATDTDSGSDSSEQNLEPALAGVL